MTTSLGTRELTGKKQKETPKKTNGQLQPGELLQSRYRIMGTLGVGGFSAVYQARDMRFSNAIKICAIKEMVSSSREEATWELTRKTFETESSILATLEHPSIPKVYDFFSEEDRNYLVMEFIRGKDLEATANERTEPIPQSEVLVWGKQICDIMVYLHSQQPDPIVFRDLKPSNLMLDQHNRIRLIDFGIAKIFKQGSKNTTVGTEGYSPPEQYRGEATPAGDVYALGASLHHLLTLKDPRLEPPFSWTERPITQFNQTVTQDFEYLINKCLAYKAADRYKDAIELKAALDAIGQGAPTRTMGQPIPPQAQQQPTNTAPPPQTYPTQMPTPPQSQPPYGQEAPAQIGQTNEIIPIWTFKCEDEIRSQPAVSNNFVYVGAYDNNLYAINRQDGSFRWKYPATDGIGSAPSVYKDDIYIGSVDQNLYCINRHNGHLRWQFPTMGPVYSSPRAEYDHVFFGSDDGYIYAVNVTNGRQVWKTQAHGPVRSTPLVMDDAVIVGTEGGYVFSIDLNSKVKWQFQAKRAVTSSPTAAEEMIFVGSMDSTVYALDQNSGWAIWRARTTRPIISSPTVNGDILFIGSADGKLYAFDIYTGRQVWAFETEGQVASSPLVVNDAVYFGSTDGYIYSVSTKRGKLRWRFKTKGYVISSPVVKENTIYIGSSDHVLYALPL